MNEVATMEKKADYIGLVKRDIKNYNELQVRCNIFRQRISDLESLLCLEASPVSSSFKEHTTTGGKRISQEEYFIESNEEYKKQIVILKRQLYELERRLKDIDCCVDSLDQNEATLVSGLKNGETLERLAEKCFCSVGGVRRMLNRVLQKMVVMIYGYD